MSPSPTISPVRRVLKVALATALCAGVGASALMLSPSTANAATLGGSAPTTQPTVKPTAPSLGGSSSGRTIGGSSSTTTPTVKPTAPSLGGSSSTTQPTTPATPVQKLASTTTYNYASQTITVTNGERLFLQSTSTAKPGERRTVEVWKIDAKKNRERIGTYVANNGRLNIYVTPNNGDQFYFVAKEDANYRQSVSKTNYVKVVAPKAKAASTTSINFAGTTLFYKGQRIYLQSTSTAKSGENRTVEVWKISADKKTRERIGNYRAANGSLGLYVTPKNGEQFYFVAKEDATYKESVSSTSVMKETVQQSTTLKSSAFPSGGGTYFYSGKSTTVSGTVSGGAREVSIWRVVNGSSVKAASTTSDSKGAWKMTLPLTSKLERYFLYAPAHTVYKAGQSSSVGMRNSTASVTVAYASVTKKNVVPTDKTNTINTFASNVPANANMKVTMQQKSGSKWVSIKSWANQKGSAANKYPIPAGNTSTTDGTRTYRLQFTGNGIKTTYSKEVSVYFNNPYKGTANERKAYDYYKKYCPNVPVTIANTPSGTWGIAQMGSTNSITISPKVPAQHLKTVAIHECVHHMTYAKYGGNWEKFKADMNKVYGGSGSTGMERATDCAANVISKNSYWGYRYPSCGGAKGKAVAKALASNRKY